MSSPCVQRRFLELLYPLRSISQKLLPKTFFIRLLFDHRIQTSVTFLHGLFYNKIYCFELLVKINSLFLEFIAKLIDFQYLYKWYLQFSLLRPESDITKLYDLCRIFLSY